MTDKLYHSRFAISGRLLIALVFFAGFSFLPAFSYGHQTPSTIALLDVSPGKVAVELQLPLGELALAFGQDVTKEPETLVKRLGPQLGEYLHAHIHAFATKKKPLAGNGTVYAR